MEKHEIRPGEPTNISLASLYRKLWHVVEPSLAPRSSTKGLFYRKSTLRSPAYWECPDDFCLSHERNFRLRRMRSRYADNKRKNTWQLKCPDCRKTVYFQEIIRSDPFSVKRYKIPAVGSIASLSVIDAARVASAVVRQGHFPLNKDRFPQLSSAKLKTINEMIATKVRSVKLTEKDLELTNKELPWRKRFRYETIGPKKKRNLELECRWRIATIIRIGKAEQLRMQLFIACAFL